MTKLEEIQKLIEMMHQDGVWNVSEYTHGMLNGLIVAEGVLREVPSDQVDFVAPPDTYLNEVEEAAREQKLYEQQYNEAYQDSMKLLGWTPIW